ncbi:HAD-IA family hydrolase [Streptomyces sp. A7024]|uniref:HAD-IA family hydrolase n=1 Tax=Streptomyces coryli TaxID=1128680 RepID=A0A6G4U402_9ACTN|nr:HAD-IA family hydrolase [Streptomyces coryli]NGN66969.1 HAD-IA family hydrolase [Streptomyces coryli]
MSQVAHEPLLVEVTATDGVRVRLADIRVLLFDMDGTLVDSQAAMDRHTRLWADRHGLDPEAVIRHSHGRRDIDVIRELAPGADPDAELAWFDEVSCTDSEGVRPAPGAGRLLAALPVGSWGVVTSATRAVSRARMGAAGLPVPEVLVCAEDVEEGKPSPQGYLGAAAKFGADPAHCLVVEDADAGLLAARAAGMRALAVDGAHRPVYGKRVAGLRAMSVVVGL